MREFLLAIALSAAVFLLMGFAPASATALPQWQYAGSGDDPARFAVVPTDAEVVALADKRQISDAARNLLDGKLEWPKMLKAGETCRVSRGDEVTRWGETTEVGKVRVRLLTKGDSTTCPLFMPFLMPKQDFEAGQKK